MVLGLSLVMAGLGCQSPPQVTGPDVSAPPSNEWGLTMPADARVSRFSDALQEPAGIALGPDGAVYATTQPAAGAGVVYRFWR